MSQGQSLRVDWLIFLEVMSQAKWPNSWRLLVSRERWEALKSPSHTKNHS